MAERNVSNMVKDICLGSSLQDFLEKYEIPEAKATSVLIYLVKKGGLTEREAKIWFNTVRKQQRSHPIEQPQTPIEKSPTITLHEPMMSCPFCGEEIKKVAQKCKHCGEFLHKQSGQKKSEVFTKPSKTNDVQTIEQTSKKYKVQIIGAVCLMAVGFATFCGGVTSGTPDAAGVGASGILLGFAGMCWFLIVRILIWWHHK